MIDLIMKLGMFSVIYTTIMVVIVIVLFILLVRAIFRK